jgi:hypothetical protein
MQDIVDAPGPRETTLVEKPKEPKSRRTPGESEIMMPKEPKNWRNPGESEIMTPKEPGARGSEQAQPHARSTPPAFAGKGRMPEMMVRQMSTCAPRRRVAVAIRARVTKRTQGIW